MTDNYFFALIITALLGINFQYLFRRVALKIGFTDKPNSRKKHDGEVPLTGGLAIFLSFAFTVLLLDSSVHDIRAFFSGSLILVVIGVLDDFDELGSTQKFFMQLLAAFVAFQWGDIRLTDLGFILTESSSLELRDISLIFTIFAFLGVINALNMLDGVDGLAGSVALITTLAMAFFALINHDISSFQILGLISISLITFLFFNWRFYIHKKALVFMGDSGSLFIGFVIAYFLIKLSQGDNSSIRPITALWFFAFPIIETVTLLIRRMLQRHSPFVADRMHFHHLLQKAGFDLFCRTKIIFLISTICIGFGMIGEYYKIPEYIMFYCFVFVFITYDFIIIRAWKVRRFFTKKLTDKPQ
jgi:UDP-GlcNAc:undecaprenyl-phosphate/decaprenyl-phosphate GlcNAc-1-phosphate transferase